MSLLGLVRKSRFREIVAVGAAGVMAYTALVPETQVLDSYALNVKAAALGAAQLPSQPHPQDSQEEDSRKELIVGEDDGHEGSVPFYTSGVTGALLPTAERADNDGFGGADQEPFTQLEIDKRDPNFPSDPLGIRRLQHRRRTLLAMQELYDELDEHAFRINKRSAETNEPLVFPFGILLRSAAWVRGECGATEVTTTSSMWVPSVMGQYYPDNNHLTWYWPDVPQVDFDYCDDKMLDQLESEVVELRATEVIKPSAGCTMQ